MPKLTCLCGAAINLSDLPQRGAFDVLPEVLREPLIDKIVIAHDQAASRQDFERQVYQAHSHLVTPGILSIPVMLSSPTESQ
jgi:hypothetical protein